MKETHCGIRWGLSVWENTLSSRGSARSFEIKMPKWGLTMTEGEIVGSLKQPEQSLAKVEELLEKAGDVNRLISRFSKSKGPSGYGSRRDEHRAVGDR